MDATVLEINDIGLRLYSDGQLQLVSPGFATHDNGETWFGKEAEARVKLLPTKTEYHFWDRLSLDSLEQSSSIARSQADLVYRHLENIAAETKTKGPLIISAAGDLEQQQLALLLGMMQSLHWPVLAVIDSAVAACGKPAPGRRLFYLDLHLHRANLSELSQEDQLVLQNTTSFRDAGMMRLREAWSDAITRLFVRATRFDPQHDAAVEQQLYSHLDQWIDRLKTGTELEITLSRGDDRYTTHLDRETIMRAARPHYKSLLGFLENQLPSRQPVTLAVSPHLAALPGFMPQLEALPDCEVQVTGESAVLKTADVLDQNLPSPGDEVPHIIKKPWFSQTESSRHQMQLTSYRRRTPTHVLFRARAWPLGTGLFIGTAEDACNPSQLDTGENNVGERHCLIELDGDRAYLEGTGAGPTTLNGKPLTEKTEVGAGDRIGIGNPVSELLLITVAGDAHGS